MRLMALVTLLGVVCLVPPRAAVAQSAPKSYASAADVAAAVAKMKSERKDTQPMLAQSILRLAPYNVSIEYRVAVANAAIHETEAELFYVVDGAATLVTGGKLVNAKRTNPQNQSGSAIEGGSAQRVAKGDFVVVAEGMPHWFSAIESSVTLMSLHLPRDGQAR